MRENLGSGDTKDMENITTSEVENAEDAFNAYASQAETAPHKWGENQEAELARLANNLRALYNKHNVADYDRISL